MGFGSADKELPRYNIYLCGLALGTNKSRTRAPVDGAASEWLVDLRTKTKKHSRSDLVGWNEC